VFPGIFVMHEAVISLISQSGEQFLKQHCNRTKANLRESCSYMYSCCRVVPMLTQRLLSGNSQFSISRDTNCFCRMVAWHLGTDCIDNRSRTDLRVTKNNLL